MNTEQKFQKFLETLSDSSMSDLVGYHFCRGTHEEFLNTLDDEQKEDVMDCNEYTG